jgi:DNA-binding SARP family transcriptional activator
MPLRRGARVGEQLLPTAEEAGEDRVEIRLLGPLRVRRADGSVVDPREWRTTKTADLLRLVALRGGEPVSVGSLLEALWPGKDEDKSRASLRTALSQIRKVLPGPEVVQRVQDTLVLRDAWVDAVAFTALAAEARRQVREGRLAQALTVTREAEALYLQDFQANDAGAHWVAQEREALARAYRTLVADAADAAVELGWMRDAVDFASRSLVADPCSERAYRALMQAYAGLGETERALREYERCRIALAEELGADPSAQTRALYGQLLAVEPVVALTPPFVGREAETQWLRSVLRSAREDAAPALVCITGPPGVGRDRLLIEVCQELTVRLVRLSVPRTSAQRADIADVLLRGLGGADGAERRHAAAGDAEGAGDALHALGRLVGSSAPTLLAVRDAHRADAQSLRRLGGALPAWAGNVVVVLLSDAAGDGTVGAARGDAGEAGAPGSCELLRAVADVSPRVHTLTLAPLVHEEVAELAEELLAGPPSSPLVAELAAASGGRPGRIVAMAREWSRTGRIVATTGGLALMPPRDPSAPDPAMRPLLARALEQLPAQDLEVLQVAAMLPGAVTPTLVSPLLGEDEDTAERADLPRQVQVALDRLVDLSLMTAEPTGYAFRHALLRDAVRSWLRPTARRRLHRRVAERALIPAAERITHWLGAGEPQLACAAAMDASVAAMAEGRYDDARSHLMQVCSLGDMPGSQPSDRVGLFERLGDACAMLGRRGEARASYAVAAKVSRAHELPDLDRVTAKGEAVSSQDWVEERSPATALPAPAAGPDLATKLGIDPATPPHVDVEEQLREALDDADRRNDPLQRVEARLLLSRVVCTPRRQLGQTRLWTQQALSITVDPAVRAAALHVASLPDVLLGNARYVDATLEQARTLAEEAGDAVGGVRIDVLRCLVAHDLGSPAFPDLWARLSEHRDGLDGEWSWVAVRILTERGRLAEAQAADRHPVPAVASPQTLQLRSLASAALSVELGAPEQAITALTSVVDTATGTGCTLLLPEAAARLVVLEAPRDLDTAQEYFELFDWAVGAESGLPREGCWRLLARAAIRGALGQYVRAAAAVANAADVAESRGLPFLGATAHLARAGYLAEAGWPAESRLATAAAARCYRSAGADSLARRAEAFSPGRPRAVTGTATLLDPRTPGTGGDALWPAPRTSPTDQGDVAMPPAAQP